MASLQKVYERPVPLTLCCLAVAKARQVALSSSEKATFMGMTALFIAASHNWSKWNGWAKAGQVLMCARFALSTTALILNLTNLARDISQLRKPLPTATFKSFPHTKQSICVLNLFKQKIQSTSERQNSSKFGRFQPHRKREDTCLPVHTSLYVTITNSPSDSISLLQ